MDMYGNITALDVVDGLNAVMEKLDNNNGGYLNGYPQNSFVSGDTYYCAPNGCGPYNPYYQQAPPDYSYGYTGYDYMTPEQKNASLEAEAEKISNDLISNPEAIQEFLNTGKLPTQVQTPQPLTTPLYSPFAETSVDEYDAIMENPNATYCKYGDAGIDKSKSQIMMRSNPGTMSYDQMLTYGYTNNTFNNFQQMYGQNPSANPAFVNNYIGYVGQNAAPLPFKSSYTPPLGMNDTKLKERDERLMNSDIEVSYELPRVGEVKAPIRKVVGDSCIEIDPMTGTIKFNKGSVVDKILHEEIDRQEREKDFMSPEDREFFNKLVDESEMDRECCAYKTERAKDRDKFFQQFPGAAIHEGGYDPINKVFTNGYIDPSPGSLGCGYPKISFNDNGVDSITGKPFQATYYYPDGRIESSTTMLPPATAYPNYYNNQYYNPYMYGVNNMLNYDMDRQILETLCYDDILYTKDSISAHDWVDTARIYNSQFPDDPIITDRQYVVGYDNYNRPIYRYLTKSQVAKYEAAQTNNRVNTINVMTSMSRKAHAYLGIDFDEQAIRNHYDPDYVNPANIPQAKSIESMTPEEIENYYAGVEVDRTMSWARYVDEYDKMARMAEDLRRMKINYYHHKIAESFENLIGAKDGKCDLDTFLENGYKVMASNSVHERMESYRRASRYDGSKHVNDLMFRSKTVPTPFEERLNASANGGSTEQLVNTLREFDTNSGNRIASDIITEEDIAREARAATEFMNINPSFFSGGLFAIPTNDGIRLINEDDPEVQSDYKTRRMIELIKKSMNLGEVVGS